MRTPVGSSNSIARSFRHNSPVWLPSGVTLTSDEDWPRTMASAAQTDAATTPTTTSDRARIRLLLPALSTRPTRPLFTQPTRATHHTHPDLTVPHPPEQLA